MKDSEGKDIRVHLKYFDTFAISRKRISTVRSGRPSVEKHQSINVDSGNSSSGEVEETIGSNDDEMSTYYVSSYGTSY